MPVRQHEGANGIGRPTSSLDKVKPRVKPEPSNDIIDLCDSEEELPAPGVPGPSRLSSRPKRPAARSRRVKYEDEDGDGIGDSEGVAVDSDQDDFRGSSNKRRANKRAASKALPSTSKLYAIARVVTLATDGVASASESEAKLAGVSAGILSRIQKSLALAKHPGTGEAEAQQALRLATRLMSSQNLTQADLLASSDAEANQTRAGMSIVEIVSQTNAAPRNESWANQIAVAVNLFFDVKAYTTSYANRTNLSWTFYGLAINTVAAAHAFEMVHNQVLTWAYEKAAAKHVSGKTGKNSYCLGVAAGLVELAKKEKKEEMRLAIESEKKRLKDAEKQEQIKKEKQRLKDPPVKGEPESPTLGPVKPEPDGDDLPSSSTSGSRNVKLEDVVDEEDTKPSRQGIKRSASQEFGHRYSRWTESRDDRGSVKPEDEADYDDSDNEGFYDMNDGLSPGYADDLEDIKPHFDEALERDIIDLTDDLNDNDNDIDIKPKLEASQNIKPKPEPRDTDDDLDAAWHSSNQLIRFRQDAEKIADDYLASQRPGLKLEKRAKRTFKKDSQAYEQGRQDAKKIDVKRKRIQN